MRGVSLSMLDELKKLTRPVHVCHAAECDLCSAAVMCRDEVSDVLRPRLD